MKMDDKEKTTQDKPETTEENKDDGIQSKTISELDRADQIAERQKRENDRREELLSREEALAARRAVGGTAEAGQEPVKPKEETDEEYTKRFQEGEVNPFKDDGVK